VRKKFSFVTTRRINYLEISLERLQTRRTKVVDNLNALNTAYNSGILDYEKFLTHRNTLLNGKSAEQWDAEYFVRKQHLIDTVYALKHTAAKSDFAQSTKKAFSIATVFILILAALAGMPLQPGITGYAGESGGFESEVNITAYFAVTLSDNLGEGVAFSTVTAGTSNNNATDNYNNDSSGSSMYLIVSNNSNIFVDACVKADDHLRRADDEQAPVLDISNLLWANSTTATSISTPDITNAPSMTTSFAPAGREIDPGDNNYYRFWLSVPMSQPGGTYNNTIEIEAAQTGQSSC